MIGADSSLRISPNKYEFKYYKGHCMKTFTHISFLGLFAISMATTSLLHADMQAQNMNIAYKESINDILDAFVNGNQTLEETILALEEIVQQENDPALLEDIRFLKDNHKKLPALINGIQPLFKKIQNCLRKDLQKQMLNLGYAGWIKLIMRK